MNRKKYFEVFVKYCDSKFDLYNEIKAIIEEEIMDAKGIENAKAYNVLTELSNSENSTEWENRHRERISLINKAQTDIAEYYNDYLP